MDRVRWERPPASPACHLARHQKRQRVSHLPAVRLLGARCDHAPKCPHSGCPSSSCPSHDHCNRLIHLRAKRPVKATQTRVEVATDIKLLESKRLPSFCPSSLRISWESGFW